jgi:cytochrome c1
LDGITGRVGDPAQVTLRLWLLNPKKVRVNTAMPNFHLSDSEIDAILLYLNELEPP